MQLKDMLDGPTEIGSDVAPKKVATPVFVGTMPEPIDYTIILVVVMISVILNMLFSLAILVLLQTKL